MLYLSSVSGACTWSSQGVLAAVWPLHSTCISSPDVPPGHICSRAHLSPSTPASRALLTPVHVISHLPTVYTYLQFTSATSAGLSSVHICLVYKPATDAHLIPYTPVFHAHLPPVGTCFSEKLPPVHTCFQHKTASRPHLFLVHTYLQGTPASSAHLQQVNTGP